MFCVMKIIMTSTTQISKGDPAQSTRFTVYSS